MNETQTPADESVQPALPVSEKSERLQCSLRKLLRNSGRDFFLDVVLEAAPGFTILFGASGTGKTTLLDCIAGLTRPDSGRISIGNRVLFDSSKQIDLAISRRQAGYVLQDLALFPHMTVAQNVAYGLSNSPDANQRVRSMLEALHISHLGPRNAREISGGEAQRVALARTLVTEPEILLLDDLRRWNQTHRIPILYVTHSRDEVFALGERAFLLDAGHIVAQGTPHEVMNAPMQETVAQLAGFENVFDVLVQAVRPERGTMTCEVAGDGSPLLLETPLVRGGVGTLLR